jgi:hydroxypyruvate reductase
MNDFTERSGRLRGQLLQLYRQGLGAVEGRRCVARHLRAHPIAGPVRAVAIGKAAESMLAGAREVLGAELVAALLITRQGHALARAPAGTEIIEAGHPLPDAGSLLAGRRLLEFLAAGPADAQWLFLISGGASSLIEVPVADMGLPELRRFNQWLLASGLPIAQMNALRRRLSCIKGGRLLARLQGGPARALLISDVPGDDPAVIGSGLLFPPADEPALEQAMLPAWLRDWLLRAGESTLDALSHTVPVTGEIVAGLDLALDAIEEAARVAGLPVYRQARRLEGDAESTGRELAGALLQGPAGVYLWGGETTVRLPEHPGQGGRCQHLALAAATVLAGRRGMALLAAGTDGSDGPGDAAGACVDGGTLARGTAEQLDARAALVQADAGRFLAAAGDLLDTGPTGTNVADVAIGIKTAG